MSEVLDILYGNVMHELVETRRHLLFAEEQNQQLREQYDEIQESESKLKNENLDLKCKMKSLDDQLTYQERAYYQLSVLSNNHQAENHFLVSDSSGRANLKQKISQICTYRRARTTFWSCSSMKRTKNTSS